VICRIIIVAKGECYGTNHHHQFANRRDPARHRQIGWLELPGTTRSGPAPVRFRLAQAGARSERTDLYQQRRHLGPAPHRPAVPRREPGQRRRRLGCLSRHRPRARQRRAEKRQTLPADR